MPDMANVAYTDEYRRARDEYKWLFDGTPEEEVIILDGYDQYTATCLSYSGARPAPNGITAQYAAGKVILTGSNGILVYEYDIIDDCQLLTIIKHRNGSDYILFNIDLYGYSVLEPKTGKVAHYVPAESFKGGETFIWLDAFYCAANDLLAVDGCYWACPWSNQFHDFSDPLRLPLPLYCDSFALESDFGVDIDSDVRFSRFTDTGQCVIQCRNSDGETGEKIIDIVAQYKTVP